MIDTIEIPYYTSPMAMGKRPRDRRPTMWVPMTELPTSASHPFYARLNQLLHDRGFDDFAETQCQSFYAQTLGRPGLAPGIYFRLLLVGYFEGLDSERAIAWRAADSLTRLPRTDAARGAAGPFDDLADAPAHRSGDASRDLYVGAGAPG